MPSTNDRLALGTHLEQGVTAVQCPETKGRGMAGRERADPWGTQTPGNITAEGQLCAQ